MHPTVAPYGPPEGEEEVAQAADILSQSFALSPEDVRKRLALEGCHPRVLREEGRVTASASASSAATADRQLLPWQMPVPKPVKRLTDSTSRKPRATAWRMSSTVTSSHEQMSALLMSALP